MAGFEFSRKRIDTLDRNAVVQELSRVARHFNGCRFSRHEFDQHATACKGTTVLKHFSSWNKALAVVGAVKPRSDKPSSRTQISDEQLLSELERIWRQLRHRPSKAEWQASDARYSYTTYKTRFGGWTNACWRFVESRSATISSQVMSSDSTTQPDHSEVNRLDVTPPTQQRIREIPLKLRLQVFKRDGFRCVLCGRSPAIAAGVTLQIDHITPFSKGGATAIANLRTLCEKCNWGKGADLHL